MNKQQTVRLSGLAGPTLFLAVLFLCGAPLNAQLIQFQKTYSPPGATASGYCVQQTADGGYITAGRSDNTSPSYRDALLVKTTAAGAIQWTFDYDLSGSNPTIDEARYVIEVDDRQINGMFDGIPDAYVVVGWTQGLFESPSVPVGDKDIFAAKVDLNGNVIWIKRIGDPVNDYHEQAFCVKQNPVIGNYVLTGSVEYRTPSGAVESRLLMMELDARNGNIVWDHAYGWANSSIGAPERGGYSLSTYDSEGFGAPDGWVACGWTTDDSNPFNRSEEDIYVVATDWYGNALTLKQIGVSTGSTGNFSIERGYSIQQLATGDVVVSGEYEPPSSTGASTRPFLLSLSRNLSTVNFMRTYTAAGNTGMNAAYSFRESTPINGIPGFVLTTSGSGYDIAHIGVEPTPQPLDAVMFHTDPSGLIINWAWNYFTPTGLYGGGPGGGHSVRVANQGYVMTGIDISHGPAAMYMVKTDLIGSSRCDEEPLSIDVQTQHPYVYNHGQRLDLALDAVTPNYTRTANATEEVHCYSATFKTIPEPGPGEESGSGSLESSPNPVRSGEEFSLSFNLPEEGPVTVTVSDVLGKVVYTHTGFYPAEAAGIRVPTDDWAPGTYTVILHPKGGPQTTRKILIADQ